MNWLLSKISDVWLALRESRLLIPLLILLLGDAVFGVLHILLFLGYLEHPRLSLELDGGFPEMYQYLKFMFILILFCLMVVKSRTWVYLSWLFLFSYLLIDDAFRIHETIGGILRESLHLQPAFGLRAQDFGEVMVTGGMGIIIVTFLALAYRSSSERRSTWFY